MITNSKYKSYPKYKDSGVEWLGEVPEHWDALSLLYCLEEPVSDGPHETPKFIDVGIPFLSIDNIQNNKLALDKTRYISAEDNQRFSEKCKPRRGDILLGKAASVGKVAIIKNEPNFNIWSPLALIRANQKSMNNFFLFYSILSMGIQTQCDIYSNSNTQKNLGMRDIEKIKVLRPCIVEQRTIAAFLDHETGKIDELIEKQQDLIALLEEKRQAVISHAVTRGIENGELRSKNGEKSEERIENGELRSKNGEFNNSKLSISNDSSLCSSASLRSEPKFKDSGVEWLGDVPEHWSVSALGYYATLNTGATPSRANESYWSGEIPWIKTGEVKYSAIFDAEEKITPTAIEDSSVKLSPPGTLLMAMYGQGVTRGRVAILEVAATYNQACVAITPNDQLWNLYLRYFFMAAYHAIRDGGNETSQMNLNADIVSKFKVLIPTLQEQKDVVSYLDVKLDDFDLLIEKAKSAIELMQERRTALISAAVTGKIDVREFKKHLKKVVHI